MCLRVVLLLFMLVLRFVFVSVTLLYGFWFCLLEIFVSLSGFLFCLVIFRCLDLFCYFINCFVVCTCLVLMFVAFCRFMSLLIWFGLNVCFTYCFYFTSGVCCCYWFWFASCLLWYFICLLMKLLLFEDCLCICIETLYCLYGHVD